MSTESNTGVRLLVLVIGFWIVMRTVNKDSSGRTLIDHILGQSGGANQKLPASASAAADTGPAAMRSDLAPYLAGSVNPIPGATASRLDQGFDVTSKKFLAPFTGTVVASEQSDPGWEGGGYVAIANAANPKDVVYLAEGLAPTVRKGQTVKAGQAIARPVSNPYNAVVGNIEIGPANPADPLQPLAQVIKNPQIAVMSFYNWLRTIGAPAATSTSGAGYP